MSTFGAIPVSRGLVLVTGGAGFIGSHTAVALLERGWRVRALDRLGAPVHQEGVRPPWLPADVELVVGDIRARGAVSRALRGVDLVLHLAAYQDYLPDFSTFFSVNATGTALLYELIVEGRLPVRKVVVASSQAVYGEGRHRCAEHGDVLPDCRPDSQLQAAAWEVRCPTCGREAVARTTDESEVRPQNPYALSKHTQELVAFSLGRRYGIATTCLRYSIAQGRWQSPRNPYSGICRIFTLRARAGKPLIVYEDGRQRRDYVHVRDVAAANVLALEDARTDFEAYNVGGAEPTSVLEYADVVRQVVNPDACVSAPGYYRFGDTRHVVSDSGRLRALGWRQTRGVEDIVREYADWVEQAGLVDESTDRGLERMLSLGTVRLAGAPA
jgi:dTDP-L-rhamnose 4-epimerase